MSPDPTPSPLELLQRAQFLHDSTLRRHSDSLERHETQLLVLRQLAESQTRTLTRLEEATTRLTDSQIALSATLAQHASRLAAVEEATLRIAQTLDAIKDMLNRPNGH